jgi:uncharacterized protein involved in exopolysaccharide biosynthesis
MADEPKEPAQNQQQPAIPPGYPPPRVYYPPEDEIDLREYWRLMVENKRLIGVITSACAIGALVAAFVMTPIYRAEVLLAPVTEDKTSGLSALAGQFGDIASLVGINLGAGNSVDESIATLKSRELTTGFIEEFHLKPILFAGQWDPKTKTWTRHWWHFGSDDSGPTDGDAYEKFDRDIRHVSLDPKNNLVTLSIEWTDPVLAAKWANDLVKQVNNVRRQEAVGDSKKSIKFLKEQLSKTGSVEVQQSIYKLIEAQTKNEMIASTRDEYAFKVVDPAVPPEKKLKPRRMLWLLTGLIGGLLLGAMVVVGRRWFHRLGSEEEVA